MERFQRFWDDHQERPWEAREKILGCMCPQIHGMPFVKLATLMMLIGGVQRLDDSGTNIRGQIHMLIVGDPGTGKTGTESLGSRLGKTNMVWNDAQDLYPRTGLMRG